MDWTNLKINVLVELAMIFKPRAHQTFISTNLMVGNSSRCPTHSSSNTIMLCSHISSKTIKSELHKAINSFCLQEAVAGVSGEVILFAVKETSNKKKLFGTKRKKKGLQRRIK